MNVNIYDEINVTHFNEDDLGDKKYICNLCGGVTTLNNSYSHRGYHLICSGCYWKLGRLLGSDNILKMLQDAGAREEALHGGIPEKERDYR